MLQELTIIIIMTKTGKFILMPTRTEKVTS